MSFGNNITSVLPILKEFYADSITDLTYEDNPVLALLRKNERFSGEHWVKPIKVNPGQSASHTGARATSMSSNSGDNYVKFVVELLEDFKRINIDNKTIRLAKQGNGAFVDQAREAITGGLQEFSNRLSSKIFGNESGAVGRLSSSTTLSGSVVTLDKRSDILKIKVGMELTAAASETSGNERALGSDSHGLYVIAVDNDAGTFTVGDSPTVGATAVAINDSADGIPAIGQTDFLYVRGDRNLSYSGLEMWIPATAPTSSDDFNGVNRSVDVIGLAGHRLDGSSGTVLGEVLLDASTMVAETGDKLTHFVMPFQKLNQLVKECEGKRGYVDIVATANVGFKGFEVMTPRGIVMCVADKYCPADRIFGLNMDSWQLLSAGKAVDFWDDDGQGQWLRLVDDGMEARFYTLANLVCTKPRANINIQVSAV